MRIACLQFAPQLGDVNNNLNRADAVLSKANPEDLDLLVLPELAFSGYNFKSLQHISPYLEPTTSGISSLWARTTALKYECIVTVGYPEKVDITPKWPTSPEYYNSAITVNADGETIANYRKSFLYYADETWALEGPDGFYGGEIEGLGNVAMGICMDLNPYKFEAPWNAWEFAYHILHKEANLVILSMAWLTRENPRSYSRTPKEPDMETLSYWLARLEPVIRAEAEGEIIVVFANRCGSEDDATYAGTSAVLGIDSGEVKVYGILGRGEKELLVVDTNLPPQAKLVSDLSPRTSRGSNFKRDSKESDSRTNSDNSTSANSSQVSAKSTSTNLSIETELTERTPSPPSPPTPAAMDVTLGEDVVIGDIITPISPVDPKHPNLFFGGLQEQIPESHSRRESLRSTIGQPQLAEAQEVTTAQPGSPTHFRHESPRIQSKARTRHQEHEVPMMSNNMVSNGVISSPLNDAVPNDLTSNGATEMIDDDAAAAAVFYRPQSPKSRNCSRIREPKYQEPALVSHDLAQEPQLTSKTFRAPHSASAVPDHYKQTVVDQGLGPRSIHKVPRPKSMIW